MSKNKVLLWISFLILVISIWLNIKQYYTNKNLNSDSINAQFPPKNVYSNNYTCRENMETYTCSLQNVMISPKWDTATLVLCQWNWYFCRNWICNNSASNTQIPINFDTTKLSNYCKQLCKNPTCSTNWY